MRLPFASGSLLPSEPALQPYLPGLRFSFFNALTWQIATGAPLVLLAALLGASPAQAGLAYSFVYLLTPVQIVATVLVPRMGYKRLTLAGWGLRGWVLLVPFALAAFAPLLGVQTWMASVLVASCFVFCLLRAFGMAASMPWFFAMLPAPWRGRYFGSDHLMAGLSSMLTLVLSAALFAVFPPFPALAVQYLIAIAGSVLSYQALKLLPDAAPPPRRSLADIARSLARMAGVRSDYRRYLWISVGCYAFTTPIAPYVIYHLQAVAGWSTGWVMGLELVRYCGSVLAALTLRRKIDAVGAKPFLIGSLALYVLLALAWLLVLRHGQGGLAGLAAAWLIMGLAGTCWMVGNLGLLPKLMSEADRMTGVTLQGALASLTGGVATMVWGGWLRPDGGGTGLDPWWFAGLFAVAAGGALLLMAALAGMKEPALETGAPSFIPQPGALLLRPHRALAYLINLIDPRK